MYMIKDALTALCDNEFIQKLLKAENMVEDPDCIHFKDANSELIVKTTDNSLSFSFTSKSDDTRDKFTKTCDQLDDEIFEEICEEYTKLYGEGSLKTLNENLTVDGVKEFYNVATNTINNKLKKLSHYKSLLINGL